MTQDELINVINLNMEQIAAQDRTKIITDENGDKRVLMGKDPKGRYVIAITVPGKDVVEELEKI